MDALNGHGKTGDGEVSLQRSQELMAQWNECHTELTKQHADMTQLAKSLVQFREYFFGVMQQGFHDKEKSLAKAMVDSIHKCIDTADDLKLFTCWDELRSQLDDYMRLSTADVFDQHDKDRMNATASAIDAFWNIACSRPLDVYLSEDFGFLCFELFGVSVYRWI